jgi:hypothetical protein
MKKILIFSSQDDETDFKLCLKANDMYIALYDTYNLLRSCYKYGCMNGAELNETEYNFASKLSDQFFAILEEHDIHIDEL